jgi:hypothetical protein
METYTNQNGEDCVIVTNENGTIWSGLKSAYDAQQAASTLVTESAPTA